ncbi:hypothetical protein Ga0100231_020205 [Opitutaceae bacterium TAV4]|nr:hypothetical protein Ga0100231_020205 [Opitutaceae bacterium TAV4]
MPTSESEAYIWLTNFAIQLPGVAGSFNLHTKVPTPDQAVQVLTDAHRWQVAAQTLAHERTANKNEAAWNPVDVPVLIRPATAPDGPTTIEQSAGGAYAIAVSFADAILASDKCDAAIRDALRLNPLPKKNHPRRRQTPIHRPHRGQPAHRPLHQGPLPLFSRQNRPRRR